MPIPAPDFLQNSDGLPIRILPRVAATSPIITAGVSLSSRIFGQNRFFRVIKISSRHSPQGAAGPGSTLYVDFHTTKSIYPVTRCHLNAMVANTQKWEQSAAFLLDSHPGVVRWVKNDRRGFFIPCRDRGVPACYIPDFIAVTDRRINVIVEIKGRPRTARTSQPRRPSDGLRQSIASVNMESGAICS